MCLTIHIREVKTIVVGDRKSLPRPHRRERPPHMAAYLPLAITPTCQGMGLAWPRGVGGEPQKAEGVCPPPIADLRKRLERPCSTCKGQKQIEWNPTGDVGAQEYAPCPTCSKREGAP